jgi:DNA polymerase-3 subunit epsilon
MKMFKWLKALISPELLPARQGAGRVGDLGDLSFVVLDLETTGLNPHKDEILAIGAIRMRGPRILVGETFYSLIQPERRAWAETIPLHHILPDDVATAPSLAAILPELTVFCTGSVLAGYSVLLDRAFLTAGRPEAGQVLAISVWLDIRQVARWLAAQKPPAPETSPTNDDLDTLAGHYGIPVHTKHHALADAFVTAQIWQQQLAQLQARECRYLSQLVQVVAKM